MSESEPPESSSMQDTREAATRAAQARSTAKDPNEALERVNLDEKKVPPWDRVSS